MMDWLLMAFLSFVVSTGDPCIAPSAPHWETVLQQGERVVYSVPATHFPLNAIYEYEGRYYAFAGRHENDHGQCLYEIPPFTLTLEVNGQVYKATYP